MKDTFTQFVYFNLVGAANTLMGFSLVFVFLFYGMDPMLSNLFGYFIGAILSYFLNSRFTFWMYQITPRVVFNFFFVLLIAYVFNAIVFYIAIGYMSPYYAQFISGAVYTLSSFIMMKTFVFTKRVDH